MYHGHMDCGRNSCANMRLFYSETFWPKSHYCYYYMSSCRVTFLKKSNITWFVWITFKGVYKWAYTIPSGSNLKTANCSVSATSRQTSSCSVSNRMSHGQFETIIMCHCTIAADLPGYRLHLLKHRCLWMPWHLAVAYLKFTYSIFHTKL